MKSHFFLIFILLLCAVSQARAGCVLNAADMQKEIDKDGIHSALKALTSNPHMGKWDKAIDCIATGRKEWVQIAVEFEPVWDAGVAEDFGAALGHALTIDAETVLRITRGHQLGFCGSLSGDYPPADDPWNFKELKVQLAGLNRIHDKELTGDVAECRDEIKSTWLDILKTYPDSAKSPDSKLPDDIER